MSLAIGFQLGSRSPSSQHKEEAITAVVTEEKPGPAPQQDASESLQEDEDTADGDLSAIKPKMFEQCKMVRSGLYKITMFRFFTRG